MQSMKVSDYKIYCRYFFNFKILCGGQKLTDRMYGFKATWYQK